MTRARRMTPEEARAEGDHENAALLAGTLPEDPAEGTGPAPAPARGRRSRPDQAGSASLNRRVVVACAGQKTNAPGALNLADEVATGAQEAEMMHNIEAPRKGRPRSRKGDALTPRQAEILGWIRQHVAERGYPPSQREICNHFGWVGTQAAADHMRALIAKGAIERTAGKSRGLRLLDDSKLERVIAAVRALDAAALEELEAHLARLQ